jgi:phosphomannomutase
MSDTLMIGISGVRGTIGGSFTPRVIVDLVGAFGTLMEGGDVIVARDSRTSGVMVSRFVSGMLASLGCDVIDLGICPTPTAMLAVKRFDAQGGLIVTASHNPAKWNALKFVARDGIFFDENKFEELIALYNKPDFNYVSWEHVGWETTYESAVSDHIDAILDLDMVKVEAIQQRRFKVVVDACCGAGGLITPVLLNRLGCMVTELHCEPSGLFPRDPEPVRANLSELQAMVAEAGADLGIAHDADVDRIALVSERGDAVGEEYSLALVEDYILAHTPGTVVTNLSTSGIIDVIAQKYACPVIRTKVGEIHVAKTMKEEGAVIGGEGNGGIIYPGSNFTRDAPLGAALILSYLAEKDRKVSRIIDELPRFVMRKKTFSAAVFDMAQFTTEIRNRLPSWEVSTIDGLKLQAERSWIHVRPSNTEPIVRVIVEGETEQSCEYLLNIVKDIMC